MDPSSTAPRTQEDEARNIARVSVAASVPKNARITENEKRLASVRQTMCAAMKRLDVALEGAVGIALGDSPRLLERRLAAFVVGSRRIERLVVSRPRLERAA